jgi:HK97 family phage portal protein
MSDPLLQALLPQDSISRTEAMGIPSVAFCVNLIKNTVGMTPIKLYEMIDGQVKELPDDPRVALLNDNTGDVLTGCQLKRAMVKDYLLDGAGYSYLNMQRNALKSVHYVKRSATSFITYTDPIFKRTEIMVNGQTYQDYQFLRILRDTEDGVTGLGVVTENNLILSVMYNSLKYENLMNKTGGNKKGFISADKTLGAETIIALKAAWQRMYAGNTENMIVLNNGAKFQEMAASAVEQQMNENKVTNGIEACKIFNVPPAMMLDSTVPEKVYIEFVKQSCLPVFNAFESACNDNILLPSEKKTKYWAFDTKEALKAAIVERYAAYKTALDSGFKQIDEVRNDEDLPPLGIPFIKLGGLDNIFYNPKTGEIYTPNTNQTSTMDGTAKPDVKEVIV